MAVLNGDVVMISPGVNAPTADVQAWYPAGACVPAPVSQNDIAVRLALRNSGAIRPATLATLVTDFNNTVLAVAQAAQGTAPGTGAQGAFGAAKPTVINPAGNVVANY